mmetsp:Transcript_10698/g.43280  ORF Transcript_10698/g.43280 Transcript_10698/m.43280 type:complete len:230 (-) Transcript_10698:133-822(-)
MVVMVEIELPDALNFGLLCLYGATAGSVVGLMLLAMLNCTMLLVAVMKYDCVNRPVPFARFWHARCESDWRFAYRCFSTGVPLFIVVLGEIGWVVFYKYRDKRLREGVNYRDVPASIISSIALACLTLWYVHTKAKWGGFVHDSTATFIDPGRRDDADVEASHEREPSGAETPPRGRLGARGHAAGGAGRRVRGPASASGDAAEVAQTTLDSTATPGSPPPTVAADSHV